MRILIQTPWERRAAHRIAAHAELIAQSIQGDAAVADLLGVDRTRISQRLTERSLYSFQSGDERLYPKWQFDKRKTLRGLKTVLGALDPALHPLVVDHWFRTPNVDLDVNEAALSPSRGCRPAVIRNAWLRSFLTRE